MGQWAAYLGMVILLLATTGAQGVRIDIDQPDEGRFVVDIANLLTDEQEQQINARCDDLLDDTGSPLLVVAIDRMAAHGGENLRIETFAHLLFDQWGIGHEVIEGEPHNRGILLLVAKGDRRARIQLGAGWGRMKDSLCKQIMDERIIPAFKQGDFGAGIVAGVAQLDRMAREKPVQGSGLMTKSHTPWLFALGLAGAILSVVSLVHSGSRGWAWMFWGAVFSIVGVIIVAMLTNRGTGRGRGFSGGGFSGGSFGGGFSGGGGASGSW